MDPFPRSPFSEEPIVPNARLALSRLSSVESPVFFQVPSLLSPKVTSLPTKPISNN